MIQPSEFTELIRGMACLVGGVCLLMLLAYAVIRAAVRDANKPPKPPKRRYVPPQHQAYIPPSIQRDDFEIQP